MVGLGSEKAGCTSKLARNEGEEGSVVVGVGTLGMGIISPV